MHALLQIIPAAHLLKKPPAAIAEEKSTSKSEAEFHPADPIVFS
jgi:hypothetical protein